MSPMIHVLIKVFDKEEYADAFIKKGEMFCRTLGEFKKIENDDQRGDIHEGVTAWLQPDKTKITISHKYSGGAEHSFPVQGLACPVTMQPHEYDQWNLYCMYAVKFPELNVSHETEEERLRFIEEKTREVEESLSLSKEMLALGEFAVLIYRIDCFIDKVKQAAKVRNLDWYRGRVEYYDPDTFHGIFDRDEAIFRKKNIYEHQKEYRLAFDSHGLHDVKFIHVGSLDGIAVKIPTKEINGRLIHIKWNECPD